MLSELHLLGRSLRSTLLQESELCDGRYPLAPPILGSDGNLYGVSAAGGSVLDNGSGWGTVYKMTLDGQLTTLYTFCTVSPCLDGASPWDHCKPPTAISTALPIPLDNLNGGTLFKITTAGDFSVVHTFCSMANCADGNGPGIAPIQGSDGSLIGTGALRRDQ